MNSTALEMIYGRPENYRAKAAVKSGELVQLGTRAAVACCDIAKAIYHATSAYVVSNAAFTTQARRASRQLGVTLANHAEIAALLKGV